MLAGRREGDADPVGKAVPIEAGATYVFDKAYCNYAWWTRLHEAGSTFVTRRKTNAAYELVRWRALGKKKGDGFAIRDDATMYDRLDVMTKLLTDGLHEILTKHGVPHYSTQAGSMFCTFFTEGPVVDLESAMKSDTALFAKYFHAMLDRGIYLAPSQFEAGFVSTAHTTRDVERTLAAADGALTEILAEV